MSEIDRWLADREARVAGLKPGVAAGVVWAAPSSQTQTSISLVYLHGYTASRGEIYPAPDRIAAALGANLFYARLAGHGCDPDGHRTATLDDWVNDGLEALAIGRALGKRTVVMATSTGGALAAWLALGPAGVHGDASIFVSPNFTVRNRSSEVLLWPRKEWLLKVLVGSRIGFRPQNELQERFWDCNHHSHSLIPMMELVNRARACEFRRWPTPVLGVYDPADPVVDERVTERLLSKIPEDRVTLHRWKAAPGDHRHVLAGDALSPGGTQRMVELCVAFVRRVLP